MKKLVALMLIVATGCAQVGELREGISAMPAVPPEEHAQPPDRREEEARRTVVILAAALAIIVVAASMARSATKDILRPR